MARLFKMYEQADYQYLSVLGVVFRFAVCFNFLHFDFISNLEKKNT